ncbi:MAG: hypothetical protein WC877_01540 [Dehalococcoidales bacterium]|jgi:hypothetical protein
MKVNELREFIDELDDSFKEDCDVLFIEDVDEENENFYNHKLKDIKVSLMNKTFTFEL